MSNYSFSTKEECVLLGGFVIICYVLNYLLSIKKKDGV